MRTSAVDNSMTQLKRLQRVIWLYFSDTAILAPSSVHLVPDLCTKKILGTARG